MVAAGLLLRPCNSGPGVCPARRTGSTRRNHGYNLIDFIDEGIKIVTRARSQAGNCLRPGVTVDAQGAVSAAGGNVPVPSDRAGIAGISQAAGVGV